MLTPGQAYKRILEGNFRFVSDTPAHLRQDFNHREKIEAAQTPFASLFGCSDSRLSAEIIFDVGLGDLFVVRNAGHVTGASVLGSLEYSVEVLKVPLILVLGHDGCGAIKATVDSLSGGLRTAGDFIQDLVKRLQPTVESAKASGTETINEIANLHIKNTVSELVERSSLIAQAVRSGKLAVVGASYQLSLGEVTPLVTIGNID